MKVISHGIIAKAPDRFYGWPANCGMWSWPGESPSRPEILVSFIEGAHLADHGEHHAIDTEQPSRTVFARSLDGGESWSIERTALSWPDVGALEMLAPDEEADNAFIPTLTHPIDFTSPDLALMFQNMGTHYPSRSWFYYTLDRGHSWNGPYRVPMMARAMSMRTDYTVLDKNTLYLGMTASREDGYEGVTFAGKLCDGGLRWERLGDIGTEPNAGFRIMPATCILPDGSYISATRFYLDSGYRSIEIYKSADRGQSWEMISQVGSSHDPKAGNPPAMCLLSDGRLLLVYGKRDVPQGIIAHTSADGGKTWSEGFVLRHDAQSGDLGYPRMIIRPDGIAVAAYYYTHSEQDLRFIGCTLFDPEKQEK